MSTQLARASWIAAPMMLGVACAHVPIPLEISSDYFTCRTSSIAAAELDLVTAGFPIAAKGDGYVQTGYTQLYETGIAVAAFTGIRATVSYRITARASGPDVAWSAWQSSSSQAVGLLASTTQVAETPLRATTASVRAETSRGILNRLRSAVCGGGDYFTGEEEWARTKRRKTH